MCVFPFLHSYDKIALYFCWYQQFQELSPVSLWKPHHLKTESCFTGRNPLNPTESSYSMRYPKLRVDSNVWLCSVGTTCKPVFCLSAHNRSATAACAHLTLRCLSSGLESQCPCRPMPPITSFPSSTQASHISSQYVRPPPKDSAPPPRWTWRLIFQVCNCLLFHFLKIST